MKKHILVYGVIMGLLISGCSAAPDKGSDRDHGDRPAATEDADEETTAEATEEPAVSTTEESALQTIESISDEDNPFPYMPDMDAFEDAYAGSNSMFDYGTANGMKSYQLFWVYESDVTSFDAAEQFLISIRDIISNGDLEFVRGELGRDDYFNQEWYDFIQYYHGIPTTGHVRIISNLNNESIDVISGYLLIPDGFDTVPQVSADEVVRDYDLQYQPELMIAYLNGDVHLVWHFYTLPTEYAVDAITGVELYNESTIMT